MVNDSLLTPVSELLILSWHKFQRSFLPIIRFNLVGIFLQLLVIIFAALSIIFILNLNFSLLTTDPLGAFLAVGQDRIVIATILTICLLVLLIIISAIMQIGSIIIIDADGKTPFVGIIKQSLSLILPVSLTNLMAGLLILGGFGFFVIPGLILLILFTFVQYETILGTTKYLTSLRLSATVIRHNLKALLVRFLVIMLISMSASLIFKALGETTDSLSIMTNIISSLFNWFFGIFTIGYYSILYRQANTNANNLPPFRLTWAYILACIGWIILIATIILSVQFLPTIGDLLNSTDVREDFQEYYQKPELPDEISSNIFYN